MTRHHRFDIDDDEGGEARRGILKDGERLRVPLMMMDSVQQSVCSHFQPRMNDTRALVTDAYGGSAGLHKPGYRYASGGSVNDIARDAREQAYALADAELEAAYRGGARERDHCVVGGKAGTLVMVDGHLVCCPRAHQDSWSPRDGVERAYEQYDREIEQSWRSSHCDSVDDPGSGFTHSGLDRIRPRDHPMSMDEVYAAYDREVSSAWARGK